MANVQVHREDLALDAPMLVEGLPGAGLVGKIAADHLVDDREMVHYASLHCEGLPEVAVYDGTEGGVLAPVRLYADEATDLLVLQSDVPVSPSAADSFASCLTEWLAAEDVTPIYCSGMPAEKDGVPSLWGVATGDGEGLLGEADLDTPDERGAVSGPTGALLYEAERRGLDGVGLIVEADPQFPDPESARILLLEAVAALTGVSPDTDRLVERADEIADAKAELAAQMQEAGDESTQAKPLRMYQ